jgi:transposase-like protein
MTVSLVARRAYGVAPNQLFTWRRLVAQGSLTAAGKPASRCGMLWVCFRSVPSLAYGGSLLFARNLWHLPPKARFYGRL